MTTVSQRVLEQLLNTSRPIPVQKLADSLSVSCKAIWKAIQSLKGRGYNIHSDPKEGYQLLEATTDVDPDYLYALLPYKTQNLYIESFDCVTSTNDLAKEFADTHPNQQALFIARQQSHGRGRHGRTFYSQLEHGLYFSLVLPLQDFSLEEVTLFSIMAAEAMAESIEKVSQKQIAIKWINDLFSQDGKIGGILCESILDVETMQVTSLIIGIGVNLSGHFNQAHSSVQKIAACLFPDGLPSKFNINHLIIEFLDIFYDFLKNLSDRSFLNNYQRRLLGLGKWVTYRQENRQLGGVIQGINNHGHLLVEDAHGEIVPLTSGHIHFSSTQFWKMIHH